MGTVGGNLCQQVRCWYFRHPDLQCWLRGGDTCYAQIGDHRKHGLEPGDCISVAPSDLAAALLAWTLRSRRAARRMPLADLYRRATADERSTLTLEPGEFLTAVEVPRAPDASAYVIAGERAAWSFALVASRRHGSATASGWRRSACRTSPGRSIPATRRRGSPAWTMTRWKRRLLETLARTRAPQSSGERPDPRLRRGAAAAAASRGVQRHPRLDAGGGLWRPAKREGRDDRPQPQSTGVPDPEASLLATTTSGSRRCSRSARTPWPMSIARPGARLRGLQLVLRAPALPAVVRRPRARPERHRGELLHAARRAT